MPIFVMFVESYTEIISLDFEAADRGEDIHGNGLTGPGTNARTAALCLRRESPHCHGERQSIPGGTLEFLERADR